MAAQDGGAARFLWVSGADGKRIRRKVSGRTGTEVKDKLQLLHDELRQGASFVAEIHWRADERCGYCDTGKLAVDDGTAGPATC